MHTLTSLVIDMLIRVNELIFHAYFYILEMEGDSASSKSPIILGRPFLKTVMTKLDVHSGTMSMEFGDNVFKFNIFDAMQHLREEHYIVRIDVINDAVDELFDFEHDKQGRISIDNIFYSFTGIDQAHVSSTELLPSTICSSTEQPLQLELKTIPEHLTYAFLEKDEQLPVIIAKHLLPDQEMKLLQVLQAHKKAIG